MSMNVIGTLLIARLHALQKLVGMSTVSLLKLSFVRDFRIPLLVYGHILDNASFPLPSCINVNYSARAILHYSSVTWSEVTMSFVHQKICPVIY